MVNIVQLRGLEGKNVLVTGASKGQGLSHVLGFAEAGANIIALDIVDPIANIYPLANREMLMATEKAVQEIGTKCIGLATDIRDEEQVRTAVTTGLEYLDGRIDIVVNNAGIAAVDSVTTMRGNVLDAIFDTIVKGHMYVVKYAVPNMIERKSGKIINISSGTTAAGNTMLSHYIGAKAALEGLTRTWAAELAEFNINVNAIAPATIRPGEGQGSGMVSGLAPEMDMNPEEAFEELSVQCNAPGSKWRCESSHITDSVLFLASDNADQITGNILRTDSGMSIK